jgi:hypothetical protein
VSEADRLTTIDHLTGQLWVGANHEAALASVWNSFGADFSRVAGTNPQRWRNSVARHAGIYDAVPEAQRVRRSFASDVLASALRNLATNRTYASEEMQRLGLPRRADEPAAPLNEAQSGEIARSQVAAEGLAKLQRAQEIARQAFVGYQQVLRHSDTPAYRRVRFDPDAPPPLTQLPRGGYDLWDDASEESVSMGPLGLPRPPGVHVGEAAEYLASIEEQRRLTAVQPYEALKTRYNEVQSAIAAHLAAFPQLYAISVQGSSAVSGRLANARTPEAARAVLADALRTLLANIDLTEQRLRDGDLDPLDLTPIHDRLFDGRETAPSGIAWSEAFPRLVGEMLARDHHIGLALRRLALHSVAQIAFVFAPVAGRLAVPALLAGTVASGANLALDASLYQALSDAAGSGARPGTELVTGAAVDEARMATEADALAFGLAVLVLAPAAARAAIRGFEAIQEARLTAQRARLLPRVGAPSEVWTNRPTEVPYGLPESEMRIVRPGSPLRLDRLNPNRRYLWVVDEQGNFRIADEAQGARFPRRPVLRRLASAGETPLKHGDLAPGPGGQTRGVARAVVSSGRRSTPIVGPQGGGSWTRTPAIRLHVRMGRDSALKTSRPLASCSAPPGPISPGSFWIP